MNANDPKILVVDDNPDIHDDFRKILARGSNPAPELASLDAALFGDTQATAPIFTLESAYQGEQAVEMVRKAAATGQRYGLAFVDVRMPPGIDGVQTIQHLRNIDPNLSCVICTAYSDYTPESARQKIGISEGLLFVSKPFDPAVIRQLADSMLKRRAA